MTLRHIKSTHLIQFKTQKKQQLYLKTQIFADLSLIMIVNDWF